MTDDASFTDVTDHSDEGCAPTLVGQAPVNTPPSFVSSSAPVYQAPVEYNGPTDFLPTEQSFAHLLTATELCDKIKTAIASGSSREDAVKGVAVTLMSAPFQRKDEFIACPIDFLKPETTVGIKSRNKNRYVLEVKIPHPLDPSRGLVEVTQMAFGGIVDFARPGFVHDINHKGTTMSEILGPHAIKADFKWSSINTDLNFLTMRDRCPMEWEAEVRACVKAALVGDGKFDDNDTDLIIKCGMEIVKINTAAVIEFHKMLRKVIPDSAANPPLFSTSDPRKGILGEVEARTNIRNQGSMVMFVKSDRTSRVTEPVANINAEFIDTVSQKLSVEAALHGKRAIFNPPLSLLSRANTNIFVMGTKDILNQMALGVFSTAISISYGEAASKMFSYMNLKYSLVLMAGMKKKTSLFDASQIQPLTSW